MGSSWLPDGTELGGGKQLWGEQLKPPSAAAEPDAEVLHSGNPLHTTPTGGVGEGGDTDHSLGAGGSRAFPHSSRAATGLRCGTGSHLPPKKLIVGV